MNQIYVSALALWFIFDSATRLGEYISVSAFNRELYSRETLLVRASAASDTHGRGCVCTAFVPLVAAAAAPRVQVA